MIPLWLLLAATATRADVSDWFALRTSTVDSTGVSAHDLQSGVVIRYGSWLGVDHAKPVRLRQSPRLLRRESGSTGGYSWELLELSEPSAEAKGLVEDFGQVPNPGTWEAALVEAHSPPVGCDRQLQYFIRKGKQPYIVFTAVSCSPEQRTRVRFFLEAFMSGVSPPEVAHRKAFGAIGTISDVDRGWLGTRPRADAVLGRLGTPSDMWPSYPDGFTLLYDDADRSSGRYIAVDFDRTRSVARVRPLVPMKWGP